MLSQQDNEAITQVGPGTLMGDFLRLYWQPVVLSFELPEPDGRPVRIRLLGEDLIAFRNTEGRVGVFNEFCAHRGASLYFARNERSGLRCVYHGWMWDLDGNCLDMPNEPAWSRFSDKVKQPAYPTYESSGVVWAYMGPRDKQPPPPEMEHLMVPENHVFKTKVYMECNWLQAVEGDLDSSHVSFLHNHQLKGGWGGHPNMAQAGNYAVNDPNPHFEIKETDYGSMVGARRNGEEDTYYWRMTEYVMPFHTMIPSALDGSRPTHVNAWVPVDDDNTIVWRFAYHPERPVTAGDFSDIKIPGVWSLPAPRDYVDDPPPTDPNGRWRIKANAREDYFLDIEAQREERFFGVRTFWLQDQAIVESMGRVWDRSREHVGTADRAVIHTRNLLLRHARRYRESGQLPPGRNTEATRTLRPLPALLPREYSWEQVFDYFRGRQVGLDPVIRTTVG